MGLLELFGKKSGVGAVKKHATRVANKRAQAPDRWESIRALGEIGSPDAIEALLVRFTYAVDPSITDQEEKDAVFDSIVRHGPDAVEPIRAFLRRTESISWPLKCLDRILSEAEVVTELLDLLQGMDTEYERSPEKKIQVLSALEERKDPRIAEAASRFFEDVNETARFHAVATVLAQDEAEKLQEPLIQALAKDDSVRVRARILDAFVDRGWSLSGRIDEVRPKLPTGYTVDNKGKPRRASVSR